MLKGTPVNLVDLMRNTGLDNATEEEITKRKEELEGMIKDIVFLKDFELQKKKKSLQLLRKQATSEKVEHVPKNIDLEMDVPLGVFVVLKPTRIKDVTRMYLRWEDETKSCVPFLMDSKELQGIKLAKKPKLELKLGEYCIVQYEGDILNNTGRYRGQIKRLPGKDLKSYKVHLIDIGCDEEVEANNIYELPRKFYEKKRLCFQFGLLRYSQVESREAIFGVEEYLQKAFALYTTAVRVDALVTPKSYPTSQTMHWGEIHCFSGELQIIDDLLHKKFIELRKGIPGSLMRLGENAVPTYLKVKAASSKHLITKDKVKICESASGVKEQIESVIKLHDGIGVAPYRPWLKGVGEFCLVMIPESENLVRGRVLFIDGTQAWITLLDCGGIIQRTVLSLKEMPWGLQDFEPLARVDM